MKIALIFALFLFPLLSAAQVLPDTPSGKRASAYIEAFNSGDETSMQSFFESNFIGESLRKRSMDERMNMYRQIRSELQTITVKQIIKSQPDQLTLLAQAKNGSWLTFDFRFDAAAEYRITGISVELTEQPEEKAERKTNDAELVSAVGTYLDEMAKSDEFSGVALIAKNDKPIYQKMYGMACKEFGVPNRMDTKFNLGSMNKAFTKLAIHQLAEQGKLSPDDLLGKHLPDYPNREAVEKVKIQHLLEMSSGIGDFFGEKFDMAAKDRFRSLSDFLFTFANDPLQFEPGTNRQYSNGGYIVLGLIIEKVSGQNYYDYVRQHIFRPAGMKNTDSYEADAITPNLAFGYTRENCEGCPVPRNNIYSRPARGSSAGGGYSTAEDLLKFSVALKSGKLLSQEQTKKYLSNGGLGIAGGAPGINAALEIDTQKGYTIIVLSNYDPPIAETIGQKIRSWVP